MASRKDSSSKRLFQLFEETRLSRQLAERFFEDDLLKPANTSFDRLFNFNNDMIHATFSRIALRLREDDKKDASMLAAFKKAGLDHQNPLHWRELLSMFAEVHFGPIRTKPQKWDSSALCEVLKDYLTIKSEKPGAKETEIRKLLREDKRFRDKYWHYNIHAFRKLLRQARSPKTNLLLRHPEMKDPLLQLIREDYEQKCINWTSEREAFIKGIVERYFDSRDSKDKD